MFYSVQVLSKGGPLQIIWLAAHMDKDLKRPQIDSTSISEAVDTIILPPGASTSASQNNEAPLALRLSGQLLLGLVKIFDRKVTYLKVDCEEALQKMTTTMKEEDGEHRVRQPTPHAPQARRPKKAASHPAPGREEVHREGSNERNNNNGSVGLHSEFAVEDEEIFKDKFPPESAKDAAGGSTSGKIASTILAPALVPGSHATDIMAAASRQSLGNTGRTVKDTDDEMFEAVPDQFDYDLPDHEMQELAKSKGQVPLPGMDAGTSRSLYQSGPDDDDDDDDMGGDGGGYAGDADDEADPYAHPDDDGPSASGRPEDAAIIALNSGPDGLLAAKAARGSQGADIRGLSFSRHKVTYDSTTTTMNKEEYSKQLKDTSAIVRPLSAIIRQPVADLAKQVAGEFNVWGYEEFILPDASEFSHLADSAGNGPSSSAAASVSIGEAARRRLNMAEGLPPVEYLVWSLPTWAADELWDLTATAILGRSAKGPGGAEENPAPLASAPVAERGAADGNKRSRDSMEGSLVAAAQVAKAATLVPSTISQPSPAAQPSSSNQAMSVEEELSDGAAVGGDVWDDEYDDGWLGATPRHRDWATDDEERSISRRGTDTGGGAMSARLGEEAQSYDERSRAATGDAGFTARTKALVSRLKQLLLPSTLTLPPIPESARALFGSQSQSQSQPFSNGPSSSKRQKTDAVTSSPSSSDAPGPSSERAVCTLSQLLPPPVMPERAPKVKGSLQLPASPPQPTPAPAAASASALVAATPAKGADAAAAGVPGTPGLHAKRRMRAAQTFYDLLVLQNRGFVKLNQPEAYEDLGVQPLGPIASAASTQSQGLPAELVAAALGNN